MKQTPERCREKLRHEELKRNPNGNMSDSFNNGGLIDLVESIGWKGTLLLLSVIVIGYFIVTSIF